MGYGQICAFIPLSLESVYTAFLPSPLVGEGLGVRGERTRAEKIEKYQQ